MRPELSAYEHFSAGKVREIYEVDDSTLLLVTSDRISAFDYILDSEIPDKGRVLTAMSNFFFENLEFPNHLAGPIDDERIPEEVLGRAMVCNKLNMLPFECVARGYLTGSALAEYERSGSVCGISLPDGLKEASRLPEPIFTPATKADYGDHDENVSFEVVVEKLGKQGIRAEVDTSDDRMQKKIRNHTTRKVPFMLLAGARDKEAGAVSFRFLDGSQVNGVPVEKAVETIVSWVRSRNNEQPSKDSFELA